MSWQFLGVLGLVLIVAAFLEGGISVTGVANISRAKGTAGAVVLVLAGVAVLGIGYATWREDPRAATDEPGAVARIVDRVMSGIDDVFSSSRPDLTVSPASGRLGQEVTLSGSGFDDGERIDIRAGNRVVASPRADEEGAFTVAVVIPGDTFCPGDQCTLVAQGKDSLRWIDAFYDVG